MRTFILASVLVLAGCSGNVITGLDGSTDGSSGSDGSATDSGGGSDSSASDSGSDARPDGGPGMCPYCNDGFMCCMVMSSGNYMKCTAKACLACCM